MVTEIADKITSEQTGSIAKKLLAVMADVTYVRKDKRNEFHKYNYASEQAIKEALHPILVKHGLLFIPIGCDVLSEVEIEKFKDGKLTGKDRLITVRFAYRFVDAESGEFIEGYSLGSGIDNQDKSIYKAITGALKYVLTGTFLIPTGDDPEREEVTGSTKAQEEVANRKIAKMSQAATPEKSAIKSDDMIKAFEEMQGTLGEELYRDCLRQHGFTYAREISDKAMAREIYKHMGEVRKVVQAATHGELIKGINETIFLNLPETSLAAVQNEYKRKLIGLMGSDAGLTEFESIRAKSANSWVFCNNLQIAITKLAKQQGIA